ncbi:RNA polymerase sigma factor [Sodalis sp. dw_96]|uniref:RNA polymerase sigma factor n=1 Tax=Sodalis sp. dw_96 TaxID=2719794 RepID=UPI001BD53490|nr:RNA polymerase sigma factor [Sodalis sp. dw_96]
MRQETDPDLALLIRVGAGDGNAMRQLVARKLPWVLSLAQRMLGDRGEAEDVAQELFVRVWQQAPHWKPGVARFDSWLYRVALNLCHDRLRAHREQPVEILPETVDPALEPAEMIAARQRSERMRRALMALPPRQREALVLHYFQGLPQAEVADLMAVSEEALESMLARARQKLRISLQADKTEEFL